MKTLLELLDQLAVTTHRVDPSCAIDGLVEDSRACRPGVLFLARPGDTTDGRDYIADAEAAGAACILSDAEGCRRARGPAIECTDPASLARDIADRLYGQPSRALTLIGITGTNGKTTTSIILHHLLHTPESPCGLIGGVFNDDGRHQSPAALTTPQGTDLSRLLASMVEHGCSHAVMEVSSHALAQGRINSLKFDLGVFTNLSGDHLDFHGSMQEYARAKRRLFELLPAEGCAVINIDDERGIDMAAAARCHVIECGSGATAHVLCMHEDLNGSRARFEGPWGGFEASIPLVGRHNLHNALQAVAVATRLGVPVGRIIERLATCPCPPGRLQRVSDSPATSPVFVDFAHTDDALRSSLSAVRSLLPPQRPLGVLFGCGGDRDRTKRPRMAAAALDCADHVFITSDNPRTEDPDTIINDIVAELNNEDHQRITVLPDRHDAIDAAVLHALEVGMTLVIAGKGHEQVQLVNGRREPFDDMVVATAALRRSSVHLPWCTVESIEAAVPNATWRVKPPSDWTGCRAVSIDSRTLNHGDLFIAIRGARHDGHDHLEQAVAGGAGMLIVEREVGIDSVPTLVVPDARAAMAQLARFHRDRLGSIPVIGITGSCGKTTVKDMLEHVLSELGPVWASRRSFNNDIGLPLTLLGATERHHAIVLEMGTNSPGEIAGLADVARPDYGIITMIGTGHLEGLESVEGIAREKYALLQRIRSAAWIRDDGFALPEGVTAAINTFDPDVSTALASCSLTEAGSTFTMLNGGTFTLPLPGRHNALNAIPVIQLARTLGLDDAAIQRGFDRITPTGGRGSRSVIDGVTFIDESYNANPDSMHASIDAVLESATEDQRIVLIIGDMLELGADTEAYHAALGRHISDHASNSSIDLVLLVGQHVQSTARELAAGNRSHDRLAHEPDVDDAAMERIASLLVPGDTVLLKASRGLALERIMTCRRAMEMEDARH
ncbi:MAG: UDP-N-acetylmuramoyl-L-alanyl-D-glutamate--2,6-diaminopimelate ligase [Phycisphaerales bacterium]|nr:UDP-N-acetylmuramoyl-L-alanyl-D-glutamate--2,6-diaminopimelate ligase [Phycisphaerales bacterium]